MPKREGTRANDNGNFVTRKIKWSIIIPISISALLLLGTAGGSIWSSGESIGMLKECSKALGTQVDEIKQTVETHVQDANAHISFQTLYKELMPRPEIEARFDGVETQLEGIDSKIERLINLTEKGN